MRIYANVGVCAPVGIPVCMRARVCMYVRAYVCKYYVRTLSAKSSSAECDEILVK